MKKAPFVGLLLAALAAPTLGAVFGHAWFDMNISELPASCDPGRVFMVKDGNSATDCATGTGSTIVACVCDTGGASYTGHNLSGGSTNLNDIGDATGTGAVSAGENDQTWTWTSGSGTAAALDAFTLDWTYPSTVTTDSGVQTLLTLELLDNAGDATGSIDNLLLIDNTDANDAPS